jgi:hypothetical protein
METLINDIAKAPYTQYMYYVAELTFSDDTSKELPVSRIREFLLNLEQKWEQLRFKWMKLDSPGHGSLFVIIKPHPQNLKLPGDGYKWLRPELTIRQNDMEISYFLDGKQLLNMNQTMNKVHYRYLSSRNIQYFQVIHYLQQIEVPPMVNALPEFSKSVAEMTQRNEEVPIVSITTSATNPYMATVQRSGMSPSFSRPATVSATPTSKILHSPPVNPSLRQQQPLQVMKPSDDVTIDDIPEIISVRDTATERYLDNHNYMGDIFSHKTAGNTPIKHDDIVKYTFDRFSLVDILMSDPSRHTQPAIEMSIIQERIEAVTKTISMEEEIWQKRKQQHTVYVANMEKALNRLSLIQTEEELKKCIDDNHLRVVSDVNEKVENHHEGSHIDPSTEMSL